MFTSRVLKAIRTIFNSVPDPPVFDELFRPERIERFNDSPSLHENSPAGKLWIALSEIGCENKVYPNLLTERNVTMTLYDLAQLSPEEFTTFIISHFESQGYRFDECRSAPAGKLLLFQRNGALCVVLCLPNLPLPGEIWDVTSLEVACCVKAVEILTAACGYVITRSRFSFGAKTKAKHAAPEIVLVDGEKLKRWIL